MVSGAVLAQLWWWSWCCGLVCGYEARRGGAWNGRDRFHKYPHPAKGYAAPKEAMVDVVNDLGLRLLTIHNERNENNIAISPYGALAVLVALGEGIQGDAVREIQYAAQLPNDISVIRVGLRDIHRHLKSYFIPKEGFLVGLTLNQDNVTLNPEYEEILRFYGYDVMSFNNAPFPATEGPQKESGGGGTTETATTETTTAEGTGEVPEETDGTPTEPTATIPEEPAAETTTTIVATISEEPAFDATEAATVSEEAATEASTTTEETTPGEAETETTAAPEAEVVTEGTTESIESTAPATTETTATDPGDATGDVPPMDEATEVVSTEKTPPTEEASSGPEEGAPAEPTEETPPEPTEGAPAESVTEGATPPEPTEEVPAEPTEDTLPEPTEEVIPAKPTEDTSPEPTEEVIPAEPTEDTPPEPTEQVPAEPTEDTPPEPAGVLTEPTEETSSKPPDESTTIEPTEDSPPEPTEGVPVEPTEESVPTEALSGVVPVESSANDLPSEQFGGEAKRKRSGNLVELNLIHPVLHNRNTRSIVDYVIARYYDEYRPDRRWYSPERPGFLVYGRYREYHVSFMRYDTVLPFYYIPHLDAMALSFPLDNKNYYLLLILPVEDDGIDRLICELRLNGSLRYIIDNLRERHVVASIPSFSLKGYVVLTPSFQELGVKKIFEPRQADFTPMTKERDIYVRNIEQAITVNIRNYVDPNSLEHQRSLNQYSPVEFKADHPFVYFVMDSKLQIALMTGKIVNPLNSRIR